jgi:hypothetical protein
VCIVVLIIPSYFITRIRPTEAIKFSWERLTLLLIKKILG